jgi:uncharacterized protein YbaP (TraB family)
MTALFNRSRKPTLTILLAQLVYASSMVRLESLRIFRKRKLFFGITLATLCVAASDAQAPARNFLWTITAPGGPPSYLMGSLHVLTPAFYPLSQPIENAFAASKVLITEADIDEISNPATMMSLMGKAMLSDGRTLDQVISADLYKQVLIRAENAGLPAVAVQRLKPWMVALALTAPALKEAGFNPEHGVDKHFSDRAKKAGLERRALETVAYQSDRMDQMSDAEQEALLRSTIEDLETQSGQVKTMADAWAKGDTATLEKLLLASMKSSPELYKRMLVERNANWVASVEQCIVQKTSCFVVVGAAHLIGDDSLVAMLQKKGYKVEQQ